MFLFVPSPYVAEFIARIGLDWVLVDLEHGTADDSDLVAMTMAIERGGSVPLVRVESGERIRVGRALDRGARGVMVPQVHSVAQAHAAASWFRAQPAGARGIATFTRGLGYGTLGHEGVTAIHEELLAIAQVESREAVDAVEDIASVEGIDVLFVGPADLSHALGIPGQIDHPEYESAAARVAEAARAAGKAAGVLVWDPQDVGRYVASGFTFFALASEANTLDRAARSALDSARQAAVVATAPEVV